MKVACRSGDVAVKLGSDVTRRCLTHSGLITMLSTVTTPLTALLASLQTYLATGREWHIEYELMASSKLLGMTVYDMYMNVFIH